MFQRRPISTLVFALAAFSVVAMHFGMVEQSMPMLGMEGSRATTQTIAVQPAAVQTSMMPIAGAQLSVPDVRPSDSPAPAHGRHKSSDMTLVMVCQLLVLVMIIGFRFRCLLASRRLWPGVASSFRILERPHRGLRPARPPGLTLLCVANC